MFLVRYLKNGIVYLFDIPHFMQIIIFVTNYYGFVLNII